MKILVLIRITLLRLGMLFGFSNKFFCRSYYLTLTLLGESSFQITKEYKLEKLKFGRGDFSTHAIEFAKWMRLLVEFLEKYSSDKNDIKVQIIDDKVITSIVVETDSIVEALDSYYYGELDVWSDHAFFTSDYIETFYSESRIIDHDNIVLYDDKDIMLKSFRDIALEVANDNFAVWHDNHEIFENILIDDSHQIQTKNLKLGKLYYDEGKGLILYVYEDNNVILTKIVNYSAYQKREDKYYSSLDLMSFITTIRSMLEEVQMKLISPNQLNTEYDMKMVQFFSKNIFSYALEVADTNFNHLAQISELPIFRSEIRMSRSSIEHSGNLYQFIKDIDITLQEKF